MIKRDSFLDYTYELKEALKEKFLANFIPIFPISIICLGIVVSATLAYWGVKEHHTSNLPVSPPISSTSSNPSPSTNVSAINLSSIPSTNSPLDAEATQDAKSVQDAKVAPSAQEKTYFGQILRTEESANGTVVIVKMPNGQLVPFGGRPEYSLFGYEIVLSKAGIWVEFTLKDNQIQKIIRWSTTPLEEAKSY